MANSTLLSKNCQGVDATFVGYRLASTDIENFVKGYLEEQKIDGILNPAVVISREGNNSSISVAFYIFLKTNSSDAISNRGQVPKHIQRKMGASNFRATENLKKALRPLVYYRDGQPDSRLMLHDRGNQAVLYVKCDIFKVLALMLDAPRNQFDIAITEAVSLKKGRSYVTAIKATKFNEGGGDGDVLHNIAMNIESRR